MTSDLTCAEYLIKPYKEIIKPYKEICSISGLRQYGVLEFLRMQILVIVNEIMK